MHSDGTDRSPDACCTVANNYKTFSLIFNISLFGYFIILLDNKNGSISFAGHEIAGQKIQC